MGQWRRDLNEKMDANIVSELMTSYGKNSLVMGLLWRRFFPDKITKPVVLPAERGSKPRTSSELS